MTVRLTLSDRCTADPERKPMDAVLVGTNISLRQDSVYLDGDLVLYRIDPILLGDVHWECCHPSVANGPRYTNVEVEWLP